MNSLTSDNQSVSLLDLNDDCLLEICLYLSIDDVFILHGLGNKRLCEAARARIARMRCWQISFRHAPTYTAGQLRLISNNLRSLSLFVGYSISTEKVIPILNQLVIGAANRYLKEIRLNYVHFDMCYANCLALIAHQLSVLDLSHCQLTDEMLRPLLSQCTNLNVLILYGNYELCGLALKSLSTDRLQMLEIELHEKWNYDLENFHAQNPHIGIKAAEKYRNSYRMCYKPF